MTSLSPASPAALRRILCGEARRIVRSPIKLQELIRNADLPGSWLPPVGLEQRVEAAVHLCFSLGGGRPVLLARYLSGRDDSSTLRQVAAVLPEALMGGMAQSGADATASWSDDVHDLQGALIAKVLQRERDLVLAIGDGARPADTDTRRLDEQIAYLRRQLRSQAALRQEVFGLYRLERELGRGNTGHVFEAVHLVTADLVALRVHPDERVDGLGVHPMHRAALLSCQLGHRSVLRCISMGTELGRSWVATELCSRGDLARVVRRGPSAPGRAVAWVRAAAGAIGHAHQRGIMHGRVGPEKMLLDADGHLKLYGFRGEPGVQANAAGAAPGLAGASQDLMGLGLALGGLLVGELPPPRSDVRWLREKLQGFELPDGLSQLVLEVVESGGSAGGGGLQAFVASLDAMARETRLGGRSTSRVGRARIWRRGLATLGAASLAAVVMLSWQYREGSPGGALPVSIVPVDVGGSALGSTGMEDFPVAPTSVASSAVGPTPGPVAEVAPPSVPIPQAEQREGPAECRGVALGLVAVRGGAGPQPRVGYSIQHAERSRPHTLDLLWCPADDNEALASVEVRLLETAAGPVTRAALTVLEGLQPGRTDLLPWLDELIASQASALEPALIRGQGLEVAVAAGERFLWRGRVARSEDGYFAGDQVLGIVEDGSRVDSEAVVGYFPDSVLLLSDGGRHQAEVSCQSRRLCSLGPTLGQWVRLGWAGAGQSVSVALPRTGQAIPVVLHGR